MSDYEIEDFLRVWDGKIVIDREGICKQMQERAKAWIAQYPGKSEAENEHSLAWCEKMLGRTKRGDTEGLYRMHWLLTDSLEIYFDLKGLYYFGPKKAIRQMAEIAPADAELYHRALSVPTFENLSEWVMRLKSIHKCKKA